MWSLGVIVYILLGGYPPFIENTQKALFRKIRKGEYEFHEQYWKSVSQEAKNLIGQLLTVDPKKRITAREALNNSWIMADDSALDKQDLGINLKEFKKFNAKRKFKSVVQAVSETIENGLVLLVTWCSRTICSYIQSHNVFLLSGYFNSQNGISWWGFYVGPKWRIENVLF